jgi:phosphoglycolate phosphatase-like HAD superfamily hydrolase
LVDLALTPGDGLRGRPYPDLVWTAAVRCGVDRAAAIALAGDSASDMACGVNAGAGLVAGILGGAHDEPALTGAGAHAIYASVAALADAITEG